MKSSISLMASFIAKVMNGNKSMKYLCTNIIIALSLLSGLSLSAGSTNAVVLYMTANRTKVIPLEDAREISFSGSQINIGLLSFPLSEIVRYEFGDESSSIEKIEGDLTGITIDPHGYIDFSMHNEYSPINVYSVDGTEHPFTLRDKTIDISSLSAGIYIVRIGNTSFRMLKK